MPDTARIWTREMMLALPDDGNRYELFDGELVVTPSPGFPHQLAVTLLWEALSPFCKAHRLGWVMTSPADLRFSPLPPPAMTGSSSDAGSNALGFPSIA